MSRYIKMPRYIDAEQVRMAKVPYDDELTEYDRGWNDACKAIADNAETADVVEVVRCKDCKHSEYWYRDKCRCSLWSEIGIDVFEDGFCSYGERRDND